MLHIKQILRNLWKQRFYNSINLLGIIIGLTTCILLLLYVKNEYQSDECFTNYQQIYRLEDNEGAYVSYNTYKLVVDRLQGIENACVYQSTWSSQDIVYYNNINYKVENMIYVDKNFFKVFDFKSLSGDALTALNVPHQLIITKEQALRIFGAIDVAGSSVELKTSQFDTHKYTIGAVIDNIPENSSIHFNAAINLEDMMDSGWFKKNNEHWGTMNYNLFVKLASPVINPEQVAVNMDSLLIQSEAPEWTKECTPFHLQSLSSLHFLEKENDKVFRIGNKKLVNILGVIGVFILVLAGINYFNLNLSQLEKNIQSIGIKKALGANKITIASHSILSSLVLFTIAVVCTFILIGDILPYFNQLSGSHFTWHSLLSTSNILFFASIVIVAFVFISLFPAYLTAKQNTSLLLKQRNIYSHKNPVMQFLIIFQFVLSIVLIATTLLIHKQNYFLLHTDYGIQRDQVLYIPLSPEVMNKTDVLKERLSSESNIEKVAFGSSVFGDVRQNWERSIFETQDTLEVEFTNMSVSCDFFELFGIDVVQGQTFTKESETRGDVIYNQAFVDKYHPKNILESSMDEERKKLNTIGVARNINFGTLHQGITPFAYICSRGNLNTMFVKINTTNTAQTKALISKLEDTWSEFSPNFPFEYHFMNNHYRSIYEKEIRMSNILSIASALSVTLAILGLFCLSYFMISKRTKEIGIRKVNGAKTIEIYQLINAHFIKWVSIAFVIACPIAYYFITQWLQNFAYRTPISWWIFALAGLLVFAVTLITVSWQSWKAATQNPVKSIRYE